jgi:RNase_H superfamily
MSEQPSAVRSWRAVVESGDPALLDGLPADDVVFRSPVVFTPQQGKAVTTHYLSSAMVVLGPSLRYVSEWHDQTSAVLEFEADLDGVYVQGVDILRWNDEQIGVLRRHDVTTVAALAGVPLPLPWQPERGAVQSFERVREQARLQMQGRASGAVVYEPLPPLHGFGLACLPSPSDGDIFLDFEGDPFVDEGGLEFLFGYAFKDGADAETYRADWALSRADERAAFERFVDFVVARLEAHPNLHIYHYAPYEPAALKRLMGRYATRESEIDRMLRAGLFVDLYAVVRHAIRAGVESYSIKSLEPLYAFERTVGLPDASAVLAKVQASLELGDFEAIGEDERAAVAGYNRDDCLSAWRLRDWLEQIRSDLVAGGTVIERPAPRSGEAGEDLSVWQKKIAALIERLTHDVPIDLAQRSSEQHARWLLAYRQLVRRSQQRADGLSSAAPARHGGGKCHETVEILPELIVHRVGDLARRHRHRPSRRVAPDGAGRNRLQHLQQAGEIGTRPRIISIQGQHIA